MLKKIIDYISKITDCMFKITMCLCGIIILIGIIASMTLAFYAAGIWTIYYIIQ